MLKKIKLKDGIELLNLGIGTWEMGDILKDEEEEIKSIRYALDNGINLIDTAEMYGNGNSEKLISKAIHGYDREKLFIVSKVLPSNAGKNKIVRSCEKTLENLKTDYLDMYLLHWRGMIPFEEIFAEMEKLKERGLIKNWGVSNMDIDDMEEIMETVKGDKCMVNQVLYHLGSRGIEYSLKPYTDKNGIITMAYCPIAQGGTLKDKLLNSSSVLRISEKYNISKIQVLLLYMLSKENTISIPKASKLEHMKEIVECMKLKLDENDIVLLEKEFPKPTKKLPLDIE